MERTLRFTLRASLLLCPALLTSALQAQDPPTDVVGDTGWTYYGQDTVALVRAADGHAWTLQNLGSAHIATASNDPGSFGGYYQWGRWYDAHDDPTSIALPASLLSPNNPSGLGAGSGNFYFGTNPVDWWGAGSGADTWQGTVSSATNGIDPCTYIGEGWQLPTQADWDTLIAAEGITNTVTAFGSHLKMPAAGHRDGQTGNMINTGMYGQYWSSTASGAYAKDLTVGDTWVNAADDAYRSHGMSVRCVHKYLYVGLPSLLMDLQVRLFPNPSTGGFTVDLGERAAQRIDIFGSDIRMVASLTPRSSTAHVALEGVPDGVYAVRIETADGVLWRQLVLAH